MSSSNCREEKNCCKDNKNIKYVQSGAPGGGTGTRLNPYNSLAMAESDLSWETLVVLAALTPYEPLKGGITLKDGQKIVGDICFDPYDPLISLDQPTISNEDDTLNDGNGIIVEGDATIEDLIITGTYKSAIKHVDGKNVKIKNVLITNYNTFESTITYKQFDIEYAGIMGVDNDTAMTNKGTTKIKNVVIEDNVTGAGIYEVVSNTKRTLCIKNSKISKLTSLGLSNDITQGAAGVVAVGDENNTKYNIYIFKTKILDFNSYPNNNGVILFALNGAELYSNIECNKFIDILSEGEQNNHIFLPTYVLDQNLYDQNIRSNQTTLIKNNVFKETSNHESNIAINSTSIYGNIDRKVKNNKVEGLYHAFPLFSIGDSRNADKIVGNDAEGEGSFYYTYTSLLYSNYVPTSVLNVVINDADIECNNYINTQGEQSGDLGAIIVRSRVPWERNTINVNDNCFTGLDGENNAGFRDFGNDSGNNVTVNGNKNNIVNFFYDVRNQTDVIYNVQNNYWGQSTGPDNIVGTAFYIPWKTEELCCPDNGGDCKEFYDKFYQ